MWERRCLTCWPLLLHRHLEPVSNGASNLAMEEGQSVDLVFLHKIH